MSRESEIVLEDKNGEIEQATLEEDLPYDVNADVIEIKPEPTASGISTAWTSLSGTRERRWNSRPWCSNLPNFQKASLCRAVWQ